MPSLLPLQSHFHHHARPPLHLHLRLCPRPPRPGRPPRPATCASSPARGLVPMRSHVGTARPHRNEGAAHLDAQGCPQSCSQEPRQRQYRQKCQCQRQMLRQQKLRLGVLGLGSRGTMPGNECTLKSPNPSTWNLHPPQQQTPRFSLKILAPGRSSTPSLPTGTAGG